ncbi:uncharacterized protein LOC130710946 isoform X2 [Lotus japonicus]|uniref:uncharacterized protein LOC130710946 isoform X2 n=1 Tax=Lotus japonicus TaxID=34305 RepID=UPI00258E7E46|nr:uncharacterized protein LOC130710946 isoform X2 [Lotus japonicus]
MAAGATPPCDKSDAKVTWLFLNEVIAVFYSDPVIEYHNANVSDCLESHSPLSCGSCHLHLLLLDICLLDDPFRTVDAHTRTHLFQKCLIMELWHMIRWLCMLPIIWNCWKLLLSFFVLEDGKIIESRVYNDLIGCFKSAQ